MTFIMHISLLTKLMHVIFKLEKFYMRKTVIKFVQIMYYLVNNSSCFALVIPCNMCRPYCWDKVFGLHGGAVRSVTQEVRTSLHPRSWIRIEVCCAGVQRCGFSIAGALRGEHLRYPSAPLLFKEN